MQNNPINWSTDKCSICNFPLKIDPIGPDVPNNKMSYGDFFIRYEYTFLKNIYSKDELLGAPQIKTLADYYKTYQKFIRICTARQAMFVSHVNFDDLDEEFDPELKEFIQSDCPGFTLEEIQKDIENIEIKNILKNRLKRVISKILKLDKNNQYGCAMTKPLPTGCMKKEPQPTWKTFDILL